MSDNQTGTPESNTNDKAKKPLTKEQIQKKRDAARAAVGLLNEHYPEVFDLDAARPLKIGIHHELIEDGKITKTQMRKALSAYTRHYKYLSCVAAGGNRVDLKGELGEEVTAEEMEYARQKVADVDKVKEAKKQQYEKRKKQQTQRKQRAKSPAKGAAKSAPNSSAKESSTESTLDKESRLEKKLEALVAKSTNR